MSDQLFEVAFSGQINEGANPDDVKAGVAKMFNADAAKLAQLFSGKRVVIKKNIDQATAAKYQAALNRAGARCEIAPQGGAAAAESAAVPAAKSTAQKSTAAAASASVFEAGDYGEVAPPPQVDPLGITGDQIEDLQVSIAPDGSELKDDYVDVAAPEFDFGGLEVAPVGSVLDTAKKNPYPPPPDSSGITLVDE